MSNFNTNIGITEYKLDEHTNHLTGWLVNRKRISDDWSDPVVDGVRYDSSYTDRMYSPENGTIHVRLDTGYFVQLIKPKKELDMGMHSTLGIREYRKNPNTKIVTGVLYKKDERTEEWKELGSYTFLEIAKKEHQDKTTVITENGTYIDILE